MKTPITYYGGKQGMLKDILPLIPKHSTYTESFAGGAAVLFAKEPVNINVINDLNGEVINFYRTIVGDFDALKSQIEQTLHSREQHQVARTIYEHPDYFSSVTRAWAFWVLSKMSFSSALGASFAITKTGGNKKASLIFNSKSAFNCDLKELLEQCTIEQEDAFSVIRRYDSPDAFHFIDPPYVGCNMGHYSGMFNDEDLNALLELLSSIQGKFMLTMYPNEMIARYVNRFGWKVHSVERRVSSAGSKIKRKQEELMICNY